MKQALLIIDAQQGLIEGNQYEEHVYRKEALISTINKVIKQALAKQAAIIFVRDKDFLEIGEASFQVHQKIEVPENAHIFDKEATNAFHGTGLLPFLQQEAIEHLVIMGCKTQHCIDTAVRTATVSGFDVTLVEDGHSTDGSSGLPAEQMIAHHNQVLHGHYNVEHFSVVRNSDENLFEPSHDQYR